MHHCFLVYVLQEILFQCLKHNFGESNFLFGKWHCWAGKAARCYRLPVKSFHKGIKARGLCFRWTWTWYNFFKSWHYVKIVLSASLTEHLCLQTLLVFKMKPSKSRLCGLDSSSIWCLLKVSAQFISWCYGSINTDVYRTFKGMATPRWVSRAENADMS